MAIRRNNVFWSFWKMCSGANTCVLVTSEKKMAVVLFVKSARELAPAHCPAVQNLSRLLLLHVPQPQDGCGYMKKKKKTGEILDLRPDSN